MTPEIRIANDRLFISDKAGVISGKHLAQLHFWGFQYDSASKSFAATPRDVHVILDKLLAYFARCQIVCSLAKEVADGRAKHSLQKEEVGRALLRGAAVKAGDIRVHRPGGFVRFLSTEIPRKLKEHQVKAAIHLLAVGNGANFSVPGSGKTSVVLTVFHWLRQQNLADSLFVVGPPSCFGPWCDEFQTTLGSKPSVARLAGGDIGERRRQYATNKESACDLYLTSFQTLQRDWPRVKRLFEERGLRFFFVVDEAHYIKQLGGAWANAVLNVAKSAIRRCVLTGTPFPRTYSDAFNIFDVLWPNCPPFSARDRTKIEYSAQKKNDAEAVTILRQRIGPLFYRVRKRDLRLAQQEFAPPIIVQMAKYEKIVYEAIVDRLRSLSKDDDLRDIDLLIKLRRGRMMRLRQGVSYAKLLGTAVAEYNERLLEGNLPLTDIIAHYDALETPAKLTALLLLVQKLRRNGEKVVIWSNFVQTLKLISKQTQQAGHGVRLIYGETPTENSNVRDELTREKIIAEFVLPDSGVDVLVANPAACAESISLHKTCSHAIYYDLSYNCAQYLQSLDRIHRVGGSEKKVAHYHFLQYANSIDSDILSNLRKKARNMSAIIDQDYPVYSLDMFTADDELEAYERLFKQ
jgi:SNF2 family DNA or RNA helicase